MLWAACLRVQSNIKNNCENIRQTLMPCLMLFSQIQNKWATQYFFQENFWAIKNLGQKRLLIMLIQPVKMGKKYRLNRAFRLYLWWAVDRYWLPSWIVVKVILIVAIVMNSCSSQWQVIKTSVKRDNQLEKFRWSTHFLHQKEKRLLGEGFY